MPDLRTSRPSAVYDTGDDDPRLASIVADVRARLAHACAHLPPESFEQLVLSIARTHLRWACAEETARRQFGRWLRSPPEGA